MNVENLFVNGGITLWYFPLKKPRGERPSSLLPIGGLPPVRSAELNDKLLLLFDMRLRLLEGKDHACHTTLSSEKLLPPLSSLAPPSEGKMRVTLIVARGEMHRRPNARKSH